MIMATPKDGDGHATPGVVAVFGQHFVRTGDVPAEYHRYLIEAMELRQIGDYAQGAPVSAQQAQNCLRHAEAFLEMAKHLLQ
jgi:uncharacterized protein (UPF0332 family)